MLGRGIGKTMEKNQILTLLHETAFFKTLAWDKLNELATQFAIMTVPAGTILIHEGSIADNLYLVVNGRFQVIHEEPHKDIILNEIGRGELIGEIALLTQLPRAATVIAMRDSVILKLSKTNFENFIAANPEQFISISRSTLIRLVEKKPTATRSIHTIALLPGGNASALYKHVTQQLASELFSYGRVAYISYNTALNFLREQNINPAINNSEANNEALTNWLAEQEQMYDYLLFEVSWNDPAWWNDRCVRSADHVVLIADATVETELNPSEHVFFSQPEKLRKKAKLLLVHPEYVRMPTSTANWLQLRPNIEPLHMKINSTPDMQRVVRIITEHSIGLVLSGGGIRGLSHIGALQALEELNIAIDWVGGTSAGAGIAGFFALGHSAEFMAKEFSHHFHEQKRSILDYTLPILSVVSGFGWAKSLSAAFGKDTRIEDLWKNFFCTASNISTLQLELINRGLLWKAIRASGSLPGLVPPITNDANQLLVDGGILNNLPVDLMQQFIGTGKIIAIELHNNREISADIPEGTITGWFLLKQLLLKKKSITDPNLIEILRRSIELSSERYTHLMTKQADCAIKITSFSDKVMFANSMKDLIKVGYRQTMDKADDLQRILHKPISNP